MPQSRPPSQPTYELLSKIAEGAVAEVFLARGSDGAEVVLKVVRPELAGDTEVTDRFLDEARNCQTFDHPNIVRHLGAGRLPDGRLYLATERLTGVDLHTQLARNGPLSPEHVLALALPLCDALDYLHARGVFHRDLKPDNVFLAGEDQRPVLLDFGLARFRGPRLATTGEGSAPFTPAYAAPECIEGRPPVARSDVYSLAVVLYEALSGHVPFAAARHDDLLAAQLNDTPPPLPPSCEPLAGAVLRALAKNPADRFESAGAFAAALSAKAPLDQTHISQDAPSPLSLTDPLEKPGDVLGSYEIIELIGEGGMGRVFVARHVTLGRRVALKILKPEQASKRDSVARFFSEARAVNQINHEHIVEVADFVDDREKQRVYCVMELLAGKPLGTVLKEEQLTVRRAVHIAWQIGDALQAAHAAGVVHRDVKPDNVFLIQRSGIQDYVKVLDFGVAKLATGSTGADAGAVTQTREGSILGTPTHMAPEQFLGGEVDRRADIYAFGVLLYQMLAGRLPFEGDDFGQLSAQVVRVQAPRLRSHTPTGERIPRVLRKLVRRCLAKDPEDRPQSMVEIAAVLLPLLAPTTGAGRRFVWVSAAIAAAAAAGFAVSRLPQVFHPAEAPVPPATVTLKISSTPPGATVIRADIGRRLGITPVAVTFARNESEARLRLDLPGYASVEKSLRLDADLVWDSALVPLAPAPQAAPPKAEPPKPEAVKGLEDMRPVYPPPSTGKPVARVARKDADAARMAYDLGQFDKALRLYSEAYQLAPRPNLLFDIAQCHRQLGNPERALFFFQRYQAHAPDGSDPAVTRALIEKTQADAQRQARERQDASRRAGEVKVLRAKEAAAKAEAQAADSEAQAARAKHEADKSAHKGK